MSLWRQLTHGVRGLTRRNAVDGELDEEVRDYFERAGADLRRTASSEEVARAAHSQRRDAARARETLRDYGWESVVEATWVDLRLALRRLAHSPGFALIAVLTLALGIGASTAIFSAVVPILYAPLPYPEGERVVLLADLNANGPLDVTYGTYRELAARSRAFEGLAVADHWRPALAGGSEPERLIGDRVSADYFRVLGIAPALGRDFAAADDVYRGAHVVLVSESLAVRRFGSARAILDQRLVLDGLTYTVIGVLPAGFENVPAPAAEIWTPIQYRAQAPFQSGEWGHHLRMLGRLAAGVSVDQAGRELQSIAAAPSEEFSRPPWADLSNGLVVEPLQQAVTSAVRPALLAIAGAVVLLLLIACANVTNLLLGRGVLRRGELAVRTALGAGRARILRQLVVESLVLASLGGIASLGVAVAGVRAIVALAPADLPRLEAVRLEVPAFFFALAVTTVAGLAVGLLPALRGARPDLRLDLRGARPALGGSHHGVRRALVVTEISLALLLLVGSGLLLRSVERLLSTAPGFDADHLLTLQIVTTGQRHDSEEAALAYFNAVLDAVGGVPGVSEAALSSQLPLSGEYEAYGPEFESAPQTAADETGVLRYTVTPDWFQALRIPLVRGRLLAAEDRPGAPEAIVISESLARRWFGAQDPVGQRVRFGPEISLADRPWGTVVGVVGDVKQSSLALTPTGAFYVAIGQWPWVDTVQSLVVRTLGDPLASIPDIKGAIWSVDRTPPLVRIATMDDLVDASESQRRFVLTVFSVFALAALVLAALGLYGVVAGSVAERTREIGLRAALGASPRRIVALIVRQGMALMGVGVAIGLAGALAATRGLASLLFGVTALDPTTYAGVIALLAAATIVACCVPAWRASRVDPTVALRSE